MEVAKLSAPPNLEIRYVSCNESAKKRCLSSELEETVFSLTHELFMTQWHFKMESRRAKASLSHTINLCPFTFLLSLTITVCP